MFKIHKKEDFFTQVNKVIKTRHANFHINSSSIFSILLTRLNYKLIYPPIKIFTQFIHIKKSYHNLNKNIASFIPIKRAYLIVL